MADGFDFNNVMMQQQQQQNAISATSNSAPKKDDIVENSATLLDRILGLRLSSMFGTGIFAHFTPPQQYGFSKQINQGAASLTARGGAGANFAMESLRISTLNNFSQLTKPAIQNPTIGGGFPVTNMSFSSLGNLTPLDTGNRGQSQGLGFA